jgi:hypothetical protein
MDNPNHLDVPTDLLDALAESEAELAAGQTSPGDDIMRELHESIARLESQQAPTPPRKTPLRR